MPNEKLDRVRTYIKTLLDRVRTYIKTLLDRVRTYIKTHWFNFSIFVAFAIMLLLVILKNVLNEMNLVVNGSIIDWVVAIITIILSGREALRLARTNANEANAFSREKLVALIAYLLSIEAAALLLIS